MGARRKSAKASRRKRARLLDCRGLPSPPPTGREPAAAQPPREALDLVAIERLAVSGLSLPEILAELGRTGPLSGAERTAAEAAIARGRTRGVAALKQAQYRAALEGRVSAQAQMLTLLEGGGGDGLSDAASAGVTVRRHILDAADHAGD